ncbi:hypothetical protein [Lactiplantibacillus plantarum]|uniref:hypothetical protein n=1 Tax=Lactiplantibacillus plantarum TaxID=1590 RepID=UPI002DF37438|nr:hypothetical protein [Lactiplantibacillus plantarum]
MELSSAQTNIQKKKPAHVVVPQSSRLPKGVKIKSIKFAGYEDVYDMYVKSHHNFAVNGGFIVHNCDALRYAVRQYMGDYDGSLGVKWDEQYAIGRQMGVSDY